MRTVAIAGVLIGSFFVPQSAVGKIAISKGTILEVNAGDIKVARKFENGKGDVIVAS